MAEAERYCPGDIAHGIFLSDQAYFRAGAVSESLESHRILFVDGLQHLDAGCVVEGGLPSVSGAADLKRRLDHLGAQFVRFYLEGNANALALAEIGFSKTLEILMAASVDRIRPSPSVRTRIVPAPPESDPMKTRLLASDGRLPNSTNASPAEYVALERRKIDAGYMDGFLLFADDLPIGSFGLSRRSGLLRLKNIFIHADWRKRGYVGDVVDFALCYAWERRCGALGLVAYPDSDAHRAYKRIGFLDVGLQTEFRIRLGDVHWSRLKN